MSLDGKCAARDEEPPILARLRRGIPLEHFRREPVAIDRGGELLAPHIERAGVIAVLVREQHAIDLQRVQAALREPQHDLPRAEPAIHEQARLRRLHQCAIARAAAAEDRDGKHFPH